MRWFRSRAIAAYLGAWVRWQREVRDLVIACLMLPWVVVLIVWAFTGEVE